MKYSLGAVGQLEGDQQSHTQQGHGLRHHGAAERPCGQEKRDLRSGGQQGCSMVDTEGAQG